MLIHYWGLSIWLYKINVYKCKCNCSIWAPTILQPHRTLVQATGISTKHQLNQSPYCVCHQALQIWKLHWACSLQLPVDGAVWCGGGKGGERGGEKESHVGARYCRDAEKDYMGGFVTDNIDGLLEGKADGWSITSSQKKRRYVIR